MKAPVGAVVPYVPSSTPPASAAVATSSEAGAKLGGPSTPSSIQPAGKASAQAKSTGLVEFNGVTYEPVYDGSELACKVVASS